MSKKNEEVKEDKSLPKKAQEEKDIQEEGKEVYAWLIRGLVDRGWEIRARCYISPEGRIIPDWGVFKTGSQ